MGKSSWTPEEFADLEHRNATVRPAMGSMCHDSWIPPWTWPPVAILEWNESSRSAVAPGSPHTTSLVACSLWGIEVDGAINGLCDSEWEA
jgi:hypothetical protein